ncbi:MAG: hypothetical protein ACLGSA_08645 [Acidobacteriota bacterium]
MRSDKVLSALWGLALASTLWCVANMALSSAFNAHPDEKDHVGAGQYYMEYWDPPQPGDERARGAYSNYGVSYLHQLDAVYFFAGKFARLVKPLAGEDYLALRLFNVGLFALLMALCWRLPVRYRAGVLPLFISPQGWYVFSYFNGDALPLALSFITVYLLAGLLRDGSAGQPGQAALACQTRRLLVLGGVLGLLSISKQNYYVYLAYFGAFWGLAVWQSRQRPVLPLPSLRQAGMALALAAAIFGVRYGMHVWVVRNQAPDVVAKVAEQFAAEEFKPSKQEKGGGFWGSRMRSKGVTLVQMFTGEWKWHVFTFRSAFGKYGGMEIEAPLIFYRYIGWAFWAFMALLAANMAVSGRQAREAWGLWLVFSLLTVGQSLWHSWTADFQAQGRYLFPILAMTACLMTRFSGGEAASPTAARLRQGLWGLGLTLWGMSLWSFVAVGLARIPR